MGPGTPRATPNRRGQRQGVEPLAFGLGSASTNRRDRQISIGKGPEALLSGLTGIPWSLTLLAGNERPDAAPVDDPHDPSVRRIGTIRLIRQIRLIAFQKDTRARGALRPSPIVLIPVIIVREDRCGCAVRAHARVGGAVSLSTAIQG